MLAKSNYPSRYPHKSRQFGRFYDRSFSNERLLFLLKHSCFNSAVRRKVHLEDSVEQFILPSIRGWPMFAGSWNYRGQSASRLVHRCRRLSFVRLFVYPSVRLSVSERPSFRKSIYPSVCLSVRLSVCPSVRPSVNPSVSPSDCSLMQHLARHIHSPESTILSLSSRPLESIAVYQSNLRWTSIWSESSVRRRRLYRRVPIERERERERKKECV